MRPSRSRLGERPNGTVMDVSEGAILLGGYAAKQCPVRTQLDFGPAPAAWIPAAEDQARLDAGIRFEAEVFAELRARHPSAVLIDPDAGRQDGTDHLGDHIRQQLFGREAPADHQPERHGRV